MKKKSYTTRVSQKVYEGDFYSMFLQIQSDIHEYNLKPDRLPKRPQSPFRGSQAYF